MAHPIEHAKSSAKKYGGKAEDYLPLHKWFDESKSMVADFRHRSLRHHSEGTFLKKNLELPSQTQTEKKYLRDTLENNMCSKIWVEYLASKTTQRICLFPIGCVGVINYHIKYKGVMMIRLMNKVLVFLRIRKYSKKKTNYIWLHINKLTDEN